MQKKIMYIWIIIAMWILSTSWVFASETSIDTGQIMDAQLKMIDWGEIDTLQSRLTEQIPEMKGFNLREEVAQIVTGEKEFSLQEVLSILSNMFFKEIKMYLNIIARFLLIVIMCNLLEKLSSSFKSKETTKFAFCACYIFIMYSVAQSLVTVVDLAQTTITQLCDMMMVALPTLLAFMAVSGYIASSAALAPIIIAALNMLAFAIQKVILPSVIGIVILQIVSSMSDEFKIDKLIGLFYKCSKWVLRIILVAGVGIMGFYNVILPSVDVTMKRVGMTLGVKFIPEIGRASCRERVDALV